MRIAPILTFLFIFVASCLEKKKEAVAPDYTGYIDKRIELALLDSTYEPRDTFAFVSLKIPARLDTFYKWHRTSDCTSCGRLRYRFADKKYPQFAESGWLWTYKPDSTYQLTISHMPIQERPDSIMPKSIAPEDSGISEHLPSISGAGNPVTFLSKGYMNVNGRGFAIASFISSFGEITNDTTVYVVAMTILKKNTLYITAECSAKDTTGFIDNMYKSMLSVKIDER